MNLILEGIKKEISPVLKKYGVEYAAVFGSIARGENNSESDVDIIVRVNRIPHGIWGFVGLKQDLEKVLNKKIDLISEQGISERLASRIKKDLITVYEK